MKLRKIRLLPTLLIVLSTLMSCGVDRWAEYAEQTELDMWIESVMQENYLWNTELPANKGLNYFAAPDKFLSSLLYSAFDKNYSYIDTLNKVITPSYGFRYTFVRDFRVDTLYNALVTYVLPNSPASHIDLKRGEWITKVNGTSITEKEKKRFLQTGEAVSLTLGKYEKSRATEPTGKEKETILETRTAELGSAIAIEENPVHFSQLITTPKGTKVGYLVYSHFTAGTATDEEKYNNELRHLSQQFADESITHFILDLRYNNGGSLECVQLLATLLARDAELNTLFASLQYNDKQAHKNRVLFLDRSLLGTGKNMNIAQGIVLSSSTTIGISGVMLNCLTASSQAWALVGSSVSCPGVTTEAFVNAQYGYSLHPAVCRVLNGKDEALIGGGFTPNIGINETTDYSKFLPFGNTNEALLEAAIKLIDQ